MCVDRQDKAIAGRCGCCVVGRNPVKRTHWVGAHCDARVVPWLLSVAAQIRAGLDASPSDRAVYETHKWDPCKPFVADKVGVKGGSSRLRTHLSEH